MVSGDRQGANVNSKVDNSGANYSQVRDVYNAPVTHQTIVKDNAVTYEVDPDDVEGLEKLSILVLKLMGETKAKVTAAVSITLGAGSIYGSLQGPEFLAAYASILLVFGVVCIFVGATLVTSLQYKYNSRCAKCNRFYAMQPHGSPLVREVDRRGGTQRTTKTTSKCRYCGNLVSKTETEFIEDEPEES